MKLPKNKPHWLTAVSICIIVLVFLSTLLGAYWPLPQWLRVVSLPVIVADLIVEIIYEIRAGQGYLTLLFCLLLIALGLFILFGRHVLGWPSLPGM